MKSMHPPFKEPTFKYGSTSYYILAYLHIYDKAMDINEIRAVAKSSLPDSSKITRALDVLERNNAVIMVTNRHWRITAAGSRQLLFLRNKVKLDLPK